MRLLLVIIILMLWGCQQEQNLSEEIPSPSNSGAQPFLFATSDTLIMTWQESKEGYNYLKYSGFIKNSFTKPQLLAEGKNWFVNWADFPAVAYNEAGMLASHYLPKSGSSTYAYDIQLVLQNPDTTFKLHDDTVQSEHGFVSIIPYMSNKFILSWLDGRNTSADDHHHSGDMTVRVAVVGPEGKKEKEWLLDSKVCDCCQTSMAVTDAGPVVVYRDRSGEEYRDISIRRYNGEFWSSSKRVAEDNWKILGCPVNGPKVISKKGKVVVTWFTAADNKAVVKMAVSEDNGETFGKPLIVSSRTIGRVDATFDQEDNIWISHISTANNTTSLEAKKYGSDGKEKEILTVAELNGARATGFPQMEFYKNSLFFAWTDKSNSGGIKIKRINL